MPKEKEGKVTVGQALAAVNAVRLTAKAQACGQTLDDDLELVVRTLTNLDEGKPIKNFSENVKNSWFQQLIAAAAHFCVTTEAGKPGAKKTKMLTGVPALRAIWDKAVSLGTAVGVGHEDLLLELRRFRWLLSDTEN